MTRMARYPGLWLLLTTCILQHTDAWVTLPRLSRPKSLPKYSLGQISHLGRITSTLSASTSSEGRNRRKSSNSSGSKVCQGDSVLITQHQERIKSAGKFGSKGYIDPCKVYIGNIPEEWDKDKMVDTVLKIMGQSKMILHCSKLVIDWKTGLSKGFGFITFVDPVFATICIDSVQGTKFGHQRLHVSQGIKKPPEPKRKKKNKDISTEDETAIAENGVELAKNGLDEESMQHSDKDDESEELKTFTTANEDEEDQDGETSDDEEYSRTTPKRLAPTLNRRERRKGLKRQFYPPIGNLSNPPSDGRKGFS